jgi:dolichyl-phosphate-mannose-protein mannosyltransferase
MVLNIDRQRKYSIWAIIAVLVLAIFLRFWGIERFNEFVFDEVYYAKFANNYLINQKFYNAHPPLSQYLIAIGIWIGDRLPIGRDVVNTLTGSVRSTFSYRWMNAVFGFAIIPVVTGLAYQLTRRWSYAFLATLFISLDGLFLVDSRYALNNVYLVFFGIFGHLCLLWAIEYQQKKRWVLLIIAGSCFGVSIACKWNGLWFLLGIWLLMPIAYGWQYYRDRQLLNASKNDDVVTAQTLVGANRSIVDRLATISVKELTIALIVVPVIAYSLAWIPHLIQNPTPNFWEMQFSILTYHEGIKNGKDVHPYCANWYTWPLMMRPLAYYFHRDVGRELFYDVHAMGNPLLWWFSCGSILIMIAAICRRLYLAIISHKFEIATVGLPLYFVVNYAANLLPWVKVTRCLYIYHYMGALLFATMGLAWLVDVWIHSNSQLWRAIGITTTFAIAAGFVFWLPVYLGLPLTQAELSLRMWNFGIFNWI